MTTYSMPLSQIGAAKVAAAIANQGTINISAVAVGDGNGAPIVPTSVMTALVHEVWRGAPSSVSRDPNSPTQVLVTFTIPSSAAPFTAREIALFTADLQLFAIGSIPATDIVAPASGAASSCTVTVPIVVDTAASVTVTVSPEQQVFINRLSRLPFIGVDAFVNAPPANPAVGALVVIGTAPTGIFAGIAGQLAQWNGQGWVTAAAPLLTIVGNAADGKYYQLKADGWRVIALGGSGSGRQAFTAVNDIAIGAPPANPADGDIYYLPAGPTGAWAGQTGFARWSAALGAWEFKAAALGTVIENEADGTFKEVTAGGLIAFTATHTMPALVRLATLAEATAGVDDTTAMTPADVAAALAASVTAKNVVSWSVAGSYTWVVPAGIYWIFEEVVGAGAGAAAGGPVQGRSGGGGGSGGYAAKWRQVVPGQVINIVVGAKGLGGPNTATSVGTQGGSSSTDDLIATGGQPGYNTSGTTSVSGGSPGLGSGGQINRYGGYGGDGNSNSNNLSGGNGASSIRGGGGRTSTISGTADNGLAPGSGGGGTWGGTGGVGGNGADGEVTISY